MKSLEAEELATTMGREMPRPAEGEVGEDELHPDPETQEGGLQQGEKGLERVS